MRFGGSPRNSISTSGVRSRRHRNLASFGDFFRRHELPFQAFFVTRRTSGRHSLAKHNSLKLLLLQLLLILILLLSVRLFITSLLLGFCTPAWDQSLRCNCCSCCIYCTCCSHCSRCLSQSKLMVVHSIVVYMIIMIRRLYDNNG